MMTEKMTSSTNKTLIPFALVSRPLRFFISIFGFSTLPHFDFSEQISLKFKCFEQRIYGFAASLIAGFLFMFLV